MSTFCRCHCRGCDRHFASERAFDWHRRGPWADRRCMDPETDEKARFAANPGLCRIGSASEVSGPVWAERVA